VLQQHWYLAQRLSLFDLPWAELQIAVVVFNGFGIQKKLWDTSGTK